MASNASLLDDTDDIADMPELQMSGPVRHTPGLHYEPSHHHTEREKKMMGAIRGRLPPRSGRAGAPTAAVPGHRVLRST